MAVFIVIVEMVMCVFYIFCIYFLMESSKCLSYNNAAFKTTRHDPAL
ncbi:hypothetical protein [uncultured Methanobrevibacter sp.]|nr:hypothetical protein [uncultured Methanobrevibacter sp.]